MFNFADIAHEAMVYRLLISLLKLILTTEQIMSSTDHLQRDRFKTSITNGSYLRTRTPLKAKFHDNKQSVYSVNFVRSRKSTAQRPPSKEECIADQFNYAILRGCLCYLFQSTGLSNGTFQSPQLDFVQAKQLTCLLFTFVGDLNEIVRLEFTHFLLDPIDEPQRTNSRCQSYLRVFDSLERAELNQNDQESFRLCGSERNLPQRTFYSTGRVLIVEIHLAWQYSNPIDLRGHFQFESKDWYQSSGVLLSHSICDRLMLSPEKYSTSFTSIGNAYVGEKAHSKSGWIFSPEFPRNYPVNTTCTYYFIGTAKERISIALTEVQLRGPDQCTTTQSHDRIEIRDVDTSIKLTQSGPIDQQTKSTIEAIKPIAVVCGKVAHTHIVSEGPSLTLRFVAGDSDNYHGAAGFRGKFEFVRAQRARVYAGQTRLSTRQFDSKDQVADQSIQTLNDGKGVLMKHIKPDAHRLSGVVESPNYPRSYPENLQLIYVFHVPPEMRVRIKFFDFRLDDHDPRSCAISNADRLEVYDGPYPETPQQLVLCGPEVPNALFHKHSSAGELISSSDLFTLRFLSDAVRSRNERGFVLSYAFSSGGHDPHAEIYGRNLVTNAIHSTNENWSASINEGDCQYTISSDGNEDIGHIWIARYVHSFPSSVTRSDGGKLPSCRWRLRGKPGQRIQLKLVKRATAQHPSGLAVETIPVQHDEQFGLAKSSTYRNSFTRHNLDKSYLATLKCHTPVSVELVNYRPITAQEEQEFRDMDELLREQPAGSHLAEFRSTDPDFVNRAAQDTNDLNTPSLVHSSPSSRVAPSDPVRLCADESVSQSPAAKGFMSGNVPQLDVILRLDTPVFNEQTKTPVWKQLSDYFNLGYDIQYKFVTDYGVIAPFGYQRKPGCFFEFNRSQSLKGNFSSPNYPGLYPIDLICEFRFSGTNVRKIEIEFLDFDVESASKSCTEDRLGDYVELRSCYPMELVNYPKRRLCHKQSNQNRYRIEWFEPCLVLRFFSNEMFVRSGFLGEYTFHTSGHNYRPCCSYWNWFVLVILFYFSNVY